jgi:hypothetical protein
MRVDAKSGKREFRHVRPPDRDETRAQHARDSRGVGLGGRRIGQDRGPGRSRFTGDVEKILHRDRDAGIPAGRAPGPAQHVGGIGHRPGLRRMHRDERPCPFARRIGDPRQGVLDQVPACQDAIGQGLGEFVDCAHDASATNKGSMP